MLDRVQSGTHDRCISQSSICIVTSCKTMLIYPCTKICMYCCYDPTTQLNKLSPIKAWIPEKKFLNCSSETGKARKLTRALVLANRELPSPSTLPQPLCTPTTSAPPPPTCLASSRAWPSCSHKRGCRGVWVPVGTRRLPRLGGRDLLPGSRWSTNKALKHGGHRSRGGPQFLD